MRQQPFFVCMLFYSAERFSLFDCGKLLFFGEVRNDKFLVCYSYVCDPIELVFTHGVRKCPFYLLVIFELRFHAKSTFTVLSVIGKRSCRIIFLTGVRSPQILPKIRFRLQNGAKTGNLSNSLKYKVFRLFLRSNPEKHRQYGRFLSSTYFR